MLGLTTTRRLRAAQQEIEAARSRAASLDADFLIARDDLYEAQQQAHTLLREAEAEIESLRAERAEPREVFVVAYFGEVRSVHATRQAARQAVEASGAAVSGWATCPPGTPTLGVQWLVIPLAVHDLPPGVHATAGGVHGGVSGG